MKWIYKILTILGVLAGVNLSAQDTSLFVGDTFFVSPGTVVTVNGHSINKDQFYNNGNVILNGNYHSRPGAVLHNDDTIWCSGNWIQVTGSNDENFKGTVVFNSSTPQNIIKSYVSNDFHNVVFDGGGAKTLTGNMVVDSSMNFKNGKVLTGSSDTLVLLDGDMLGGNPNSFVVGALYIKGVGQLRYPIGKGAIYREATIVDVPVVVDTPVIGFEFMNAAHGGTPGPNVYSIEPNFYWRARLRSGTYGGSPLTLMHTPGDGLIVDESMIVQADTVDGEYSSIGGVISGSLITSNFIAGEDYYTFGRSANMNANIAALLQGDWNGTDQMYDSLYIAGELNQFMADSSNAYGINMLPGYSLPTTSAPDPVGGPVDFISVYLRKTASGSNLDTSYCWLMKDGTIRDFYTGTKTYATFKNYTTLDVDSSYYVVVDHRNHLPVMYNVAQAIDHDTTATVVTFDVTNIVNIYGAGAATSGGYALMYSGNADVDKYPNYSKYIVDNDDWDKVRLISTGALPATKIYWLEDVNMDGWVNQLDWDIAKTGFDNMYYSTFPF